MATLSTKSVELVAIKKKQKGPLKNNEANKQAMTNIYILTALFTQAKKRL